MTPALRDRTAHGRCRTQSLPRDTGIRRERHQAGHRKDGTPSASGHSRGSPLCQAPQGPVCSVTRVHPGTHLPCSSGKTRRSGEETPREPGCRPRGGTACPQCASPASETGTSTARFKLTCSKNHTPAGEAEAGASQVPGQPCTKKKRFLLKLLA